VNEQALPGMPPAPASKTRLLAVGGSRHNEEVTIAGDQTSWVDLLTAETYYRRAFTFVAQNAANPHSALLRKAYRTEALVHESIAQDRQLAHAWWQSLALLRLSQSHGQEIPLDSLTASAEQQIAAQRAAEQN
jgi:hypothetical protein